MGSGPRAGWEPTDSRGARLLWLGDQVHEMLNQEARWALDPSKADSDKVVDSAVSSMTQIK